MISYKWKILEVFADGELITHVRYHLTGSDEENSVATEGEYTFDKPNLIKPFAEVQEKDIIFWLQQETSKSEPNLIKLNIENQLNGLKGSKKVEFPWETETFTIQI
jgi:hypothetical protein